MTTSSHFDTGFLLNVCATYANGSKSRVPAVTSSPAEVSAISRFGYLQVVDLMYLGFAQSL